MPNTIQQLYRFPIKGLSPEPLATISALPGEGVAGDRQFALARAATAFDQTAPTHLPKTSFLMLQRDEKLAGLKTRFEPATGTLSIDNDGTVVTASVRETGGRESIETFFAEFMSLGADSHPRLVSATGHMFSDVPAKVLSLINMASIAELEGRLAATIDPLRFRGNVYFDGEVPWSELDWVGREIKIGETVLEVVQRTQRCAATNVNPATAVRDLNIPKSLMTEYGHMDMGVYARVMTGGTLKPGMEIEA